MKKYVAILAVAGLAVTGCTAPNEATNQAAVTPTVAPTTPVPSATPTAPKPTPSPLTVAQAGKVYLAAVGPSNKARDKWGKDRIARASVKTLRADAARARAAERHFLEVLDGTLWPAKVVKNAANLSTCTAESVSWFDQMTHITNVDQIPPFPDCGGSDAQLIRARLHLSSVTN